eukprot:105784_1
MNINVSTSSIIQFNVADSLTIESHEYNLYLFFAAGVALIFLNVCAVLFKWKDVKTKQTLETHTSAMENTAGIEFAMRVQRLKHSMNGIKNNTLDINDLSITQILDDFLHLHHNDDQFEYISNEFGFCNINHCMRVERQYQYMSNMKYRTGSAYSHRLILQNILDKIHCFYCHSYDMGFRLTKLDKYLINKSISIENQNDTFTDTMHILSKYDGKIKKLNQILSHKWSQFEKIKITEVRLKLKYNQLNESNAFEKHYENSMLISKKK